MTDMEKRAPVTDWATDFDHLDRYAKCIGLAFQVVDDILDEEGDAATGAYIILRGKVKLVANSSDGKSLILRIARPGEFISLSAALSERANDTSAEVVEPTSVCFITTANLYRLMETQGELVESISATFSPPRPWKRVATMPA